MEVRSYFSKNDCHQENIQLLMWRAGVVEQTVGGNVNF